MVHKLQPWLKGVVDGGKYVPEDPNNRILKHKVTIFHSVLEHVLTKEVHTEDGKSQIWAFHVQTTPAQDDIAAAWLVKLVNKNYCKYHGLSNSDSSSSGSESDGYEAGSTDSDEAETGSGIGEDNGAMVDA
ncbi:hypothetical protein EVJ58_g1715 [Rhodofomes roseus]|nr:hypothetical protein EVJ58_g1715 [Rhodofomes roseus]